MPPQSFSHNNRSALAEYEFVFEAIKELLDRSLIEECERLPRVVNTLTVPTQTSGKKRLILDLRNVNKHIWKQSVKYDDLKIALSWRKMINDRAIGVLVIPCWRSTALWPILCSDGCFVPRVVDWFDLPINKNFCTRCKNGRGIFGNTF